MRRWHWGLMADGIWVPSMLTSKHLSSCLVFLLLINIQYHQGWAGCNSDPRQAIPEEEVVTLGLKRGSLPMLPTYLNVTIEASYSLKLPSNQEALSLVTFVTWWGIVDWPCFAHSQACDGRGQHHDLFHHPALSACLGNGSSHWIYSSNYEDCRLGFFVVVVVVAVRFVTSFFETSQIHSNE